MLAGAVNQSSMTRMTNTLTHNHGANQVLSHCAKLLPDPRGIGEVVLGAYRCTHVHGMIATRAQSNSYNPEARQGKAKRGENEEQLVIDLAVETMQLHVWIWTKI